MVEDTRQSDLVGGGFLDSAPGEPTGESVAVPEAARRARTRRNWLILSGLIFWIALLWIVTMVRMGNEIEARRAERLGTGAPPAAAGQVVGE